jgi:hypothetical protein
LYGESLNGSFEFVATGDSPVWLDEETISYRKVVSPDGFGAILVAAPIGGEPETLLTPDDLKAIIPSQTENTAYWFYLVDVVPDSYLIYVNQYQTYSTSSEPPPSRNYLLLLDRSSREITVVAEGEYLSGRFGGDGRYLITTQIDTGSIWSLNRYDIARKQTETLFQYDVAAASPVSLYPVWGTTLDWSEDGQWLLVFRDGFLILLAPDYNYQQVIVPDAPGCFDAVWVNNP